MLRLRIACLSKLWLVDLDAFSDQLDDRLFLCLGSSVEYATGIRCCRDDLDGVEVSINLIMYPR